MNGVGVVTCVYNAQRRELFLQYPTENLQCVHLTLVMSGHGYLNVVFVSKVVVVVHFTSDKGVSLCFNGFIEQKSPAPPQRATRLIGRLIGRLCMRHSVCNVVATRAKSLQH